MIRDPCREGNEDTRAGLGGGIMASVRRGAPPVSTSSIVSIDLSDETSFGCRFVSETQLMRLDFLRMDLCEISLSGSHQCPLY